MPEISGSFFLLRDGDENVTLQCNVTASSVQDSDFAWVRVEQDDLSRFEEVRSCFESTSSGSGLMDTTALTPWDSFDLFNMLRVETGVSFTVTAEAYVNGGYFVCIVSSASQGNCSSNYSIVTG